MKLVVVLIAIIALFSTSCGGLVRHQVKSGESLYSIGFYYGQDYRDIAKWNGIAVPYVIHKDQWLRVAPPDKAWWVEQRERNKRAQKRVDRRFTKNNNSTKNVEQNKRKSTKPIVIPNKRVITKDFTDQASKINAWNWPARGRVLNADKKFSHRGKGIDIRGKRGQLIYATAAGKVVYSGSGLIGYGKLIILKHNRTYLSAYAHNEKILVKEGDIVKRGQKIAHMGRTPDNHIQLHFEIRRNGKPVDPLRFLKR